MATDLPSETSEPAPEAPDEPHLAVQPTPRAIKLFLALLILAGGVAVVMRLVLTPDRGPDLSQVDFSVPDWRATPAELQIFGQVRAARLEQAPAMDDPSVKELLAAYEAFNKADLEHGGYPRKVTPQLSDAHAEYAQRAIEFAQFKGLAAFMGLGERVADAVLAALEAGDQQTVLRLGGTFLKQAKKRDLVTPKGRLSEGAAAIVRLVFVRRWSTAISHGRNVDALLAPEERLVLTRWKVAAHPELDDTRRAELAAQLRAMGSDYPIEDALAGLAARESRWELAAQLYAAALKAKPGDARLEANLRETIRRAERKRKPAVPEPPRPQAQ